MLPALLPAALSSQPAAAPDWPPVLPDVAGLCGTVARVERAVQQLRAGGAVVVVDDRTLDSEADLVLPADAATPLAVASMVRETSGLLYVALPAERVDTLRLPLMVPEGPGGHGAACTVSVDYAPATTTGISAADRAATVRALVEESTRPAELGRPGHVFPIRVRAGGVLEHPGHAEAAVDLVRLAARPAGAALARIVNADGSMARGPQLRRFADRAGTPLVGVTDLVTVRRWREQPVRRTADDTVDTRWGRLRRVAYESDPSGMEHLALVAGRVAKRPVLVHLHDECVAGDVLASRSCGCGARLDAAMRCIVRSGAGVVAYLRGAIAATHADVAGHAPDRFEAVAQMLADLGVGRVRLLGSGSTAPTALRDNGVEVLEQVPLVPPSAVAPVMATHDARKHDAS